MRSTEEILRHEEEQDRLIEKLRVEAIKALDDLYEVNSFYSMIVQLLSTLLVVDCVLIAMGRPTLLFGKPEIETVDHEKYKIFDKDTDE